MGAGFAGGNKSGSVYGTNTDGSARTAQDVINARNATFAQPFDPSMYSPTSQTRGLNKNGLPGAVFNSVTPQQYHKFMQDYYARNPQASEADARVAGFNAGIFETPSDTGGWDMFVRNILPAALGFAASGGVFNGLLSGAGAGAGGAGAGAGHTAGGLAAGGAGHVGAGAVPFVAGGGGSLVPTIVVNGVSGAGGAGIGIGGAAGGVGGGVLPDIVVSGGGPRPNGGNPGGAGGALPDIIVDGPSRPTGGQTNGGGATAGAGSVLPDIEVTAPRQPTGGNHTAGGAGAGSAIAGGEHVTPAPSPMSPNINIPWRHLLNMIPRGGASSGAGPTASRANVSGGSPFGGSGTGVGAELQGANRPSIYPWVKPGVTSAQQATPNPDEEGRM